MIDRLLSVKDIQSRYACSPATARTYIRRMRHQEKPLRVTESAVLAWEASRTYSTEKTEKPDGNLFKISRTRPA